MSTMLPRADHAEKWIVGHMLSSGELPTVSPGECFLPHVSEILTLANELHGQGVAPTVINIWEELQKRGRDGDVCGSEGLGTLIQLMNERPDVLHLTDWAAVIRSTYMQRETLLRFRQAEQRLQDGCELVEVLEIVDDLRNGLRSRGTSSHGLEVLNVHELEPKSIDWIWYGRLAKGMLTMEIGDPGHGKSQLTCYISACVTTGRAWADGSPGIRPRSVIMLNAEDLPAEVIRPRLDAAGADVRKVKLVGSMLTVTDGKKGRKSRLLSLKEDLRRIELLIDEIGDVGLIVVDPISAYCGGTDSHNNQQVRELLTPLKELAEKHSICVLAVSHLNKGGGANSTYRSSGSLAFTAAARCVLLVAPDVDDESRKLLLQGKTNISRRIPGLAYRIAETMNQVPYLAWEEGPVELDADGYLRLQAAKSHHDADADDSQLGEAVAFIREQLAAGPILSTELESAAKVHGIAVRTLNRARKEIGVKPLKCRDTGKWTVSIPDGKQASLGNDGNHDSLGNLTHTEDCQHGQGIQVFQGGQLDQQQRELTDAEIDSVGF